jgi:3-deoxy-D-manno-octulosonic-acid transferase
MLKRLSRSDVARRVAGRVIGAYLRLALGTTRWTIEAPQESWPYMLGQDGRTAIVAFWHEFLPLIPALWWHAHKANPSLAMTVLISRHRDRRGTDDPAATERQRQDHAVPGTQPATRRRQAGGGDHRHA